MWMVLIISEFSFIAYCSLYRCWLVKQVEYLHNTWQVNIKTQLEIGGNRENED